MEGDKAEWNEYGTRRSVTRRGGTMRGAISSVFNVLCRAAGEADQKSRHPDHGGRRDESRQRDAPQVGGDRPVECALLLRHRLQRAAQQSRQADRRRLPDGHHAATKHHRHHHHAVGCRYGRRRRYRGQAGQRFWNC